MTTTLDCLVVGYHDMDFSLHERMVVGKGPRSAEYNIFRKDHVRIADRALPYLDVFNYFLNRGRGRDESFYHVAEVPNAAASYLVSNLRRLGLDAAFVSHYGAEQDTIRAILEDGPPRAVALTTTFYLTPLPIIDMVRWIRSVSPTVTVIVGGPLVGNLVRDLDRETLDSAFAAMGADIYVYDGQGEATLTAAVTCLRDGGELSAVPNLYLRADGGFRYTGMRPENNSLDECATQWKTLHDHPLGPALQTRTARSCAFACAFCDYPIRAGALTLANLDTVEREFTAMAELGTRYVIIVDDTFNVPPARFKDLCRMLIRNDFGFSWFSYFRCSNVRDPEVFELMYRSGCRGVFLGIESGDDRVLRKMNKSARTDQYEFGMSQLHSHGIATFASFITGFPGETSDTVDSTIDFINRTRPTFFRCEPWWYNHNSPIHAQAAELGLRGRNYQWQHRTMDHQGAGEAADRAFHLVHGSVWMPMYNFDFWALPYLMSKGMTVEQIVEFHSACYPLMEVNFLDPNGDEARNRRHAAVNGLSAFFDSLDIAPSRFPVPAASRARLLA